ncbi:MAG TPA: Crp/Fnr family transcriptional regulator [Burkholderiaceae bacterium]|jgi:CRP/FNR family cyclic AMP-dependent transcriptional regulator|nr:Crp/Fnr family transcriptional regulator [Burkholderiaceae bacterium]
MSRLHTARNTETWYLEEAMAGPLIRLAHLGQRRVYKKGEFLYHQEEVSSHFFFILSGRVQVSIFREDGGEFVLEVMGRWALCGEADAFEQAPRFSAAVAAEETEVIVFDAAAMEHVFASHPELAVALLRIASLKQRVLGRRLHHLASPKPEKRIFELLSRLAELYGVEQDGAIVIGITLTHEQISAMTGASRVTVTRTLTRLREEGVIAIHDRQIHILDLSRLDR